MKTGEVLRRGRVVYETNPSIADKLPTRIVHSKPDVGGEFFMVVAPGTGEVVGKGAFAFVHEKVVDTEEFMKIFADGLTTQGELTKHGRKMLLYVFHSMSGLKGKDQDKFEVNWEMAKKWQSTLGRQAYFGGMKDLLDKGFIFKSLAADVYFLNIRYIFNGDRIALVQSYRRKASDNSKALLQSELPLDAPESPPKISQ